jgi:hypothetical protein
MHLRSENDDPAHREARRASPLLPARHETRSERVREIRRRIAADAYCSADVADEIARRILMSCDL